MGRRRVEKRLWREYSYAQHPADQKMRPRFVGGLAVEDNDQLTGGEPLSCHLVERHRKTFEVIALKPIEGAIFNEII